MIEFSGNQIKVYVNKSNTQAIIFYPFGRYFSVFSDTSALDMAVSLIFFTPSKEISYLQYVHSQEDTSVIYQEAA